MENTILQLLFIIGIIFFFSMIVFLLKKNELSLKYTLIWIFSAFTMFIISIFPSTIWKLSNLMGFELPSNAIFSLLFGFIIIISLSLTSIVSKQEIKIKTLVQSNALLDKRIRELEEKIK